MSPILTIITINLNNKDGLSQTISSVYNQTYKNFQYIIIDGGSIDGSQDIMHYWAQLMSLELKSEKDKGIYDAMNKGVFMAEGKWCLFLNSGDKLYNDDVLYDIFVGKGMLISQYDVLYGSVLVNNKIIEPSELCSFYYKMPFCHQSCFVLTSTCQHNPFSIDYKIASDYDMLTKLYSKCRFLNLHLPVSIFDVNGISQCYNELMQREFKIIAHKNFTFIFFGFLYIQQKHYVAKRKVSMLCIRLINRISKYYTPSLETSVSVISSNCVGTTIYEQTNNQYLSPTIGLFFYPLCFLKFVDKLSYYSSQPIQCNYHSLYFSHLSSYPVGHIDDIEIHFLYEKTCDDALQKWNRRVSRINFNNICVLMTDRDGFNDQHFELFKKLSYKKLLLTENKKYKNKDSIVMHIFSPQSTVDDLYSYRWICRDYVNIDQWVGAHIGFKNFCLIKILGKIDRIKFKLNNKY